ncbi:hypothetical protein BAV1811 [Bordetella avium 197N]|uniref:Uncharacterized protein n=2 Tax=Bordetella avium TaxID=521 RepID=Q2L0V1_BORA1|nr:hypothetical protein BAV1811 [Bordetella avium 197N]
MARARPGRPRTGAVMNTPADKTVVSPSANAASGSQVSINAKVLPPTSLVDVPNFPPKRPPGSPTPAAADEVTESNWADGSEPQPRARNARSSIF